MENKPNVKLIVVSHKFCQMPTDEIYFPIHVGAEGKTDNSGNPLDLGFQKDNTGDNISEKNFCFGTQTALYWAWKNLECDYLGLVHYRRFFIRKKVKNGNVLDSVITGEQLYPMLSKYRVFLPKKRHYYIETIRNHYSHTMNGGADQLRLVREVIEAKSPEYLKHFDTFMEQRSGYIFNMMIMDRELINDYCSWAFSIMFELEKLVDTTGYSDFDKRYMGRISERLLNIWLLRKLEQGIISKNQICELPYNESVNWIKKGISFLKAKIFTKKYGASF